jgi:cytochrome c
MPSSILSRIFFGLLVSGAGLATVQAELSWSGCDALKPTDFSLVRLVGKSSTNSPWLVDATMEEPVKLAFDMDAAGNVDVYWVERLGAVKKFSVLTKTMSLLGKLPAETENEDGLVGIALHPNFKINHWMFLYYSFGTDFRVSRFTVTNNTLDKASEIIMLKIPSDRGKDHSGGPMVFDDYGDLWISVGENSAGERAAANSNDLRGGILRIHPTDDGKYSIPAGNWRETAASSYSAADLQKIKPEIYVKGTRNAYTIAVDPVKRWLAWGDVGPDWYSSSDYAHPTEEHDLVKQPGFMGWPYFAGSNVCPTAGCSKDASGPVVNFSGNTGVSKLPPATPAIDPYARSAAMTGPIFRYNGDLVALGNKVQLPPHFNRKWILGDFRSRYVAATLDSAGTKILAKDTVFQKLSIYVSGEDPMKNTPVDVQGGPDGALYVVNYNGWYTTVPTTSIGRFEYNGTCRPTEPKLERAVGVGVTYVPDKNLPGVQIEGLSVTIGNSGMHKVRLLDLSGKELSVQTGSGIARYALPVTAGAGMRIVQVQTTAGVVSRRVVNP